MRKEIGFKKSRPYHIVIRAIGEEKVFSNERIVFGPFFKCMPPEMMPPEGMPPIPSEGMPPEEMPMPPEGIPALPLGFEGKYTTPQEYIQYCLQNPSDPACQAMMPEGMPQIPPEMPPPPEEAPSPS